MKKTTLLLATVGAAFAVAAPAALSAGKPDLPPGQAQGQKPDKPGGKGSGDGCPGPGAQVFAEQNDKRLYVLAPGGDFEGGAPGWELGEGASLQPVDGDDALVMAHGSSVVSPPICVSKGRPFARMYGVAEEDRSRVRVEVLYGAKQHSVGNVKLRSNWRATKRISLAKGGFRLDPQTGTGEIRLLFTAKGKSGSTLDDLYIDPRRYG